MLLETRGRVAFAAVCLTGGLTTLAPSSAEACYGCFNGQDAKTQPGYACQVDRGDRNHNWDYDGLGRVCNYDTNDTIRVYCPLIKDRLGDTDGLSCATATLVRSGGTLLGCGFIDRSKWRCIVQSKIESGMSGWWSGWLSMQNDMDTGTHPLGYISQDWQYSLQNSVGGSANYLDHGIYYLSCDLPPTNNCGGSNCLGSTKWIEG